MKLEDLALFCEVVDAGGMSHAASRLGLSQPNVSRTIRILEERMAASLLTRTGRGIELTRAGDRFLVFAQNTLNEFAATQQAVRDLSGALPSTLSIIVPRNTGRLMIPAIFKMFLNHMPEVALDVRERQSLDASAELMAKTCDIAVFYDNTHSPFPEQRPLFREALYMTGHKRYLGETTDPITLADCAQLPLLMFTNPPYRKMVETAFQTAGLSCSIVREVENKVAVAAFAVEGEGVAIQAFSNLTSEFENDEIQAREIVSPRIERRIMAAVGLHVDHHFAKLAFRLLKSALQDIAAQARWEPV